MKKLLLLLIIPLLSFGQEIDYHKITNPSFVSGMYKGELVDAFQWNDKLGNNIFILCVEELPIGEQKNKHGETDSKKTIYGLHYVIQNTVNKKIELDILKLWDIKESVVRYNDGETADIYFDKKATKITDLDNDNIAEVSLGYRILPDATDCCWPHEIKLIMHEESKKYAIRGSTSVVFENEVLGGDKNMYGRNSFKGAPKVFIDFASNLYDSVLMRHQEW